eukprot:9408713-Pyramimonas_sp.AAC.1
MGRAAPQTGGVSEQVSGCARLGQRGQPCCPHPCSSRARPSTGGVCKHSFRSCRGRISVSIIFGHFGAAGLPASMLTHRSLEVGVVGCPDPNPLQKRLPTPRLGMILLCSLVIWEGLDP